MNAPRERTNEAPIPTQNPLGKLLRYLERQSAGGFFGKVTVSFQNGKVCEVRTEQTRKLDEL
ncbi:MAG: hypothetical protein HOO96_00560 [Polyangiaceae bacterium]|jgi:hypothetical protein|nr:hypothetical protein [Polyangiaceae bacterium]